MSRVKISVLRRETATVDLGDVPEGFIREQLLANEGGLNDNWGLYDLAKNGVAVSIEEVLIEKVSK